MKKFKRRELTEDDIQKCHDIVDDLVGLYKATDPGNENENLSGK